MGVTIHYRGKAKSLQAVNSLIDTLECLAKESQWEYWLIDETVRGKFIPSWGIGYGYIPSKEQIKREGIEFFPKMVSPECNGYFQIHDTKYAKEARCSLRKGIPPVFPVDTKRKGICLNLHRRCETLEFTFDLGTLELANYETYEHSPGIVYGYNGFFCKTEYAGFETHQMVCKIIKMAERYIDFSDVYDEAGFYHSRDEEGARRAFGDSAVTIERLGSQLRKTARKLGFKVIIGGKR